MDINSDSSEKSQEQTLEMPKENFNNKVYLGNREIEFIKWKVKDKFAVINAKTDHQLKQALVYNCLKDKSICLDKNEFEYMLLQIRQASMSQKYKLEIECSECGKKFDYTFEDINLNTSVKFSDYSLINEDNVKIELQDIQNQEFYDNIIKDVTSKQEQNLLDFALHVKSINGNEGLTIVTVCDFLNELDTDTFEKIYLKWLLQKFDFYVEIDTVCPNCGKKEHLVINEFPKFFPASWEL